MFGALVLAVSMAVAATPLPPRTDRFVYDTAGVIDDAQERTLERTAQELFDKTGVAIVVLTVPRLIDETIDELAVRAGQTWGVGRKGEDRGLVIAFSRDDRRIFVATGYGTEGYLPDGRVGAMIDEHALPWLRRGQFSEGIVRLATALAVTSAREHGVTLTGTPAVPARGPEPTTGGWIRMLLLLLGLFGVAIAASRHPMLALLLFSGMGRSRGGGGFGGGFGGGGFGGGGFGGGGAGRGF